MLYVLNSMYLPHCHQNAKKITWIDTNAKTSPSKTKFKITNYITEIFPRLNHWCNLLITLNMHFSHVIFKTVQLLNQTIFAIFRQIHDRM